MDKKQEIFTHIYETGEPVSFHSWNDALDGLTDYVRPDYICTCFVSADRRTFNTMNMETYLPAHREEIASEIAHTASVRSFVISQQL